MVFYHGLFKCFYYSLKDIMHFVFLSKKEGILIKILTASLITILLGLGLLIFIPCLLMIFILKICVYLKYPEEFGSFLESDTLLERANMSISYVYLIEHDGSYEEVEKNVTIAAKNLFNSHHKFSSTIKRCFGIYFFRKNQVNFDNIITTVKNEFTSKQSFINYLETNEFNKLNSKIKLWDIKIFKKNIYWNNCNCYAIVVRFNHSIGDAVQLTAFQNKYFLNNVNQKRFETVICKPRKSEKLLEKMDLIQLVIQSFKMNNYLIFKDTCSQRLALYRENEKQYLKLIPKLCQKLKCTFTDIIVCACTDSILNHLKSKNKFPNEIIAGNTCREMFENKVALSNAETLRNNVSVEMYALENLEEEKLHNKLTSWLGVLNDLRNAGTSQNIDTYLPSIFYNILLNITRKTLLLVTNIPAPDSGSIGSLKVKESYIFMNNFLRTKFILCLYSFGERLQASLISHKCVDICNEDLHIILERTFSNIDELLKINNISTIQ